MACRDSKLKRKNLWQECDASYRRRVAHTRVTAMNEYGIDGSMSDHEEDRLIPLQFGGKVISTKLTQVPIRKNRVVRG
jgi:hypothetical protein